MNLKNLMMWGIIVLLVVGLFQLFQNPKNTPVSDKISFSEFFIETIKEQDDLSSVEGRSMVARFALPLINKISNDTLKQAYIKEISNICELDLSKLTQNPSNSVK